MIEEKFIKEYAFKAIDSLEEAASVVKYYDSDYDTLVFTYELDRNKTTMQPVKVILEDLRNSSEWLEVTQDAHPILIENKMKDNKIIEKLNKLASVYIDIHIHTTQRNIEDYFEDNLNEEVIDEYLKEMPLEYFDDNPFLDIESIVRPTIIVKSSNYEELFDIDFILELYEADLI